MDRDRSGTSDPAPRGSLSPKQEDKLNEWEPSPEAEYALDALTHFKSVIGPEGNLISNWDGLDDDSQSWYCAGLLRELFDDGYRELEERLDSQPRVAAAVGLSSKDPPHYSTLSRQIGKLDENTLEQAARWANNAALHQFLPRGNSPDALSEAPSKPRSYYEIVDEEWSVGMDEKMRQATRIVGEYLALTTPHLRSDRDRTAPNFKHPIESFIRLLAHIALEDWHLESGADILRWQSDDDVDVPTASTVRKYARKQEVEELEEKFLKASCALLEREELLPPGPVHLAYDVTKVRWYGAEHEWTSGGRKEANTTDFWHYAVLSATGPDRNYVLGATPMKKRTEIAQALRRLLRRVHTHADFDIGRIYFDSEMYREDIVTTCREIGANFLIQAKDTGDPGRLLEEARGGEPAKSSNIEFAGLTSPNKRVNGFAYPIHPGEVGSDNREESHTAWITDHDVDARDLRGLAYQYRNRWQVETAIRQLKHDFQGRCASDNRGVRTMYLGAAQLFFNYWVALNHELPYHLGQPATFRLNGQETLHAVRGADVESARRGDNTII
uniref:Transposase IS4 family protein n=1 Tax=Halorubrum distributum TaxID=29283 RepID=A0A2R2NVN3_9EURY|nr:transposase [Halorubrum litoreum]AKB09799.1 transposase IS4 family protein [Halorubrum litoreum]